MAAPPEITIENLNAKFVANKTLSDKNDGLLQLQGMSWLIRAAAGVATQSYTMKTYTNDAGDAVLDITMSISGLANITKTHVLDWKPRPESDIVFGPTEGQSRVYTGDVDVIFSTDEEDRKFLNADILVDGSPSSWSDKPDEKHVQSLMKSEGGWTMEQTLGFEEIEGKRHHTRRMVARKGNEVRRARLVHDYVG